MKGNTYLVKRKGYTKEMRKKNEEISLEDENDWIHQKRKWNENENSIKMEKMYMYSIAKAQHCTPKSDKARAGIREVWVLVGVGIGRAEWEWVAVNWRRIINIK